MRITETLDWLRPYLVLRILGVYSLGAMATADAALSLAYLAETLSTGSRLDDLLWQRSRPARRELDR